MARRTPIRTFHRYDGPETAPVLLFSNSLGTHHGMWEPQVQVLSQHYRLLRYDTRGHGASEVTPGPYDIALLGRDVLSLLDQLGHERVRYCGLSIGGMIGTWLAAHAPERIERLVLANTSALMGGADAWNARIDAVRADGMAAVASTVVERWFTPRFRETDPQAVERIQQMLLDTPPSGYVACCAAVRDMDHRTLLRRVTTPTLVIAGTHDPATPISHARVLAERIADARLVELDAAHLSNTEAAPAFNAALLAFLSGESNG